jgi:apolipoprotein N-acyltransferase
LIAALTFSGASLAWISAPHSWVWLHSVSWVPAFAVFARLEGRRAFLAGWLAGFAAQAAIFVWLVHTIATFTPLGAAAGVAALALFAAFHGLAVAVFAWGFAPIRRSAGAAWPFAIAAWFTACEVAQPQLFPFYQGVVWYVEPRVFLSTATIGISGISFLAFLANALALQALDALRSRRGGLALAANLLAAVALLGAALGLAARQDARIAAAEAEATPFRVALVQPGDDPLNAPARTREEATSRANALAAQARDALAADSAIRVVVLPEKALEFEPTRSWNRSVHELAPAFGIEVWTGGAAADRSDPDRPRFFNSAFRIPADGSTPPRYDKNVLVPFGEALPASLGWIMDVIGRAGFAAGEGMPIHDASSARFAFLICYEAILPAYVRDPVRRGADLLVNLTYDGWFGDSNEPAQHLMLVAAQAAQLGVPIVRATTTGLSALIDARGRITARTELFETTVLTGDVAPLRAPGLYVAWGNWVGGASIAASVALLSIAWRRSRP